MLAPGSKLSTKAFLDLLALRSFRWKDSDKFTFLWNGEIVIVKVDQERDFFFLLSAHEKEDKEQIYRWLYNRRQFIWEQQDD